jgi:cold shock protein
MGARLQGTVLWFNETKRYGFLARDAGENVFVHSNGIRGPGFKTLQKGQRVSFLLGHDHRERVQALEVEVIEMANSNVV